MPKMGYEEARKIRKESLSNRIASRLVGGESVTSSVTKSLSEGTKAKITGLKEKINPMNIAKFMTGGSPLAAAMVGRMMGASKEDMKYFTGKQSKVDTASKIKPVARLQEEGILELLNEIYLLLEDSRRARERDLPTEEDVMEKERRAEARHKALLDAIKGQTKGQKEVTATRVQDEESGSIIDDVLSAFGLKEIAKSALSGLGRLATFAVGPIGAPLLAAAAIGAFGLFIYKALKAEPSYEAEQEAKGIRQAEKVGGLAGVKDEMERRKGLPEYERTMLELKDAEKTFWKDEEGNPQFGTDIQLKGYADRSPEAAAAVEDYKKNRDSVLSKRFFKDNMAVPVEPMEPTAIPGTQGETGAAGTPGSPAAPGTPGTPGVSATPIVSGVTTAAAAPATSVTPSSVAIPTETTPPSAILNNIIKENLEMSLPLAAMGLSGETVNNTVINSANDSESKAVPPMLEIPSVRNTEETFRRMIVYSTRVV